MNECGVIETSKHTYNTFTCSIIHSRVCTPCSSTSFLSLDHAIFSLSFSVSLFLHNSNAYTKLFFTSIVGRDFEIQTFARHRKAKQDDDRQGNKHNQMRITNWHSEHSS